VGEAAAVLRKEGRQMQLPARALTRLPPWGAILSHASLELAAFFDL
jgi:hypothetical protein